MGDIDENHKDVENIILVAGQNELHAALTDEEFLLCLKTKGERLTELAQEKNVAIVKPPPQNHIDPVEQAKELILHKHLTQIEEEIPKLKVWPNPIKEYDEDGGRHPSRNRKKPSGYQFS